MKSFFNRVFIAPIGVFSLIIALSTVSLADMITITVENISPLQGTRITPVWVGFHDGTFDTFDSGHPASSDLQMLAEDGSPAGIVGSFPTADTGVVFGPVTVAGQPPIYHPGEVGTVTLDIDTSSDLYFSYLSMVIPSNDAFIGNDNPMAYKIVENGIINPLDIVVYGSMVWDAGTELNDEIPANTPLLGQAVANTGVDENGVVHQHGGFIDNGNILTAFPDADFTADNYHIARITVVPEPGTFGMLAIGAAYIKRKFRKQ